MFVHISADAAVRDLATLSIIQVALCLGMPLIFFSFQLLFTSQPQQLPDRKPVLNSCFKDCFGVDPKYETMHEQALEICI